MKQGFATPLGIMDKFENTKISINGKSTHQRSDGGFSFRAFEEKGF